MPVLGPVGTFPGWPWPRRHLLGLARQIHESSLAGSWSARSPLTVLYPVVKQHFLKDFQGQLLTIFLGRLGLALSHPVPLPYLG